MNDEQGNDRGDDENYRISFVQASYSSERALCQTQDADSATGVLHAVCRCSRNLCGRNVLFCSPGHLCQLQGVFA